MYASGGVYVDVGDFLDVEKGAKKIYDDRESWQFEHMCGKHKFVPATPVYVQYGNGNVKSVFVPSFRKQP